LARVNHKKIKQLIAQKQKTITDRQFFVSRALAAHFEDIAAAQTRRYGYRRRVRVRVVWKPKEPDSAKTDNGLVWINAGHPSVTRHKTRQARYEQVCGMFAHELGHVLYTDFLGAQTYHRFQETGKWFPEAPALRNTSDRYAETEYLELLQNDLKSQEALQYISHDILNVLEDGYIEQRMITDYPGILGANLQIRRDASFEELPTVTQMAEQEEDGSHIWMTILQCILAYMKWGQIKYGETPLTDERIQVVFSLLGDLDNALVSQDFRDRCRTANTILIRCWQYIKDFVDLCKDMAEQAAAGGGEGSTVGMAQQLLSALAGSSAEGSGETAPVPANAASGSGGGAPTAGARAATAQLAADTAEEQEEVSEFGPAAEDGGEEKEPQPEQEAAATSVDNAEAEGMPMEGQAPPGASQPVSEEETGRIPLTDTDTLSAPEGGTTERDDDYKGTGYSGAASDIQRILEKVAENSVCTELERQRTKELTELAQSISYGNIHDGVSMTVHRIAEVDDDLKEQYQEASGDLLHISKQLQKSVLQQMRDSRRGGKQTGLLIGRRLDIHALSRNDGRVFYKNALPNEIPALSVGLLLDESGSMSSCDRATYARATAIILYDFCHALGIPIMVYGHSTSGGVDLYSYAEFDAIDQNDRYRLMDISARGSNRDGAALRYVAERLAKRTEDVKLLMLVSDGQPADTGYFGTAAEEDLRGVKQEYQRKGILFVAAAIGSDKENIERIYGDSFLDISDLSKLPVKLAGIIKRFIRL
jgi:cobalamin biosynthesis protein CobT